MKRVLLTGGTGFVGANLARRLLLEGHEVHALVRPEASLWRLEEILDDIRLHSVVLTDQDSVDRAVRQVRPEWIFHLAVYGAYSFQAGFQEMVATNLLGSANLVEACLRTGFDTFVNTGSSSEYGFKDHAPAEDEWLEPNSHYAITKAAATHYCRHAAQSRGARIPTLRLYSVYGPWEDPRRLIPQLITAASEGSLPPLVHPETARDYVHVDDVSQACLLAASVAHRDPGAVYNVGSGVQTPLREVVATVRSLFPGCPEPRWGSMPGRQWDTTVWVADSGRIRQELGWEPRIGLREGLERTARWFDSHPREARLCQSARAAAAGLGGT